MLSFRLRLDTSGQFRGIVIVSEENRFLQNRPSKEIHWTVDYVKGKVTASIEANISHFALGKLTMDFIWCTDRKVKSFLHKD